jgi:hypothetical protein
VGQHVTTVRDLQCQADVLLPRLAHQGPGQRQHLRLTAGQQGQSTLLIDHDMGLVRRPRAPQELTRAKVSVMAYTVRPLDASTWDAFAELVERNNGVFGGCWCMGLHPDDSRADAAQNRAGKEQRVRDDRAHAALVLDESGTAQGSAPA